MTWPTASSSRGELLGNGISQVVVKMKPGAPVYETNYADQMASFSLFYSVDGEQERTGTGYAEEVSKAVLVDGNLRVRVQLAVAGRFLHDLWEG